MDTPEPCPCGSGEAFAACCGPCLAGQRPAPTAEALMRSRYSAYVRRDADYLLRTWHPSTRPKELDLSGDAARWLGLEVLGTQDGGAQAREGTVEFVARYLLGGRPHSLREISRFVREGGRWLYLDGTVSPSRERPRPGRNAPCSCGSGKKTKHCCLGKD